MATQKILFDETGGVLRRTRSAAATQKSIRIVAPEFASTGITFPLVPSAMCLMFSGTTYAIVEHSKQMKSKTVANRENVRVNSVSAMPTSVDTSNQNRKKKKTEIGARMDGIQRSTNSVFVDPESPIQVPHRRRPAASQRYGALIRPMIPTKIDASRHPRALSLSKVQRVVVADGGSSVRTSCNGKKYVATTYITAIKTVMPNTVRELVFIV